MDDEHGDIYQRTRAICCPTCGRPDVAEREGVVLENHSLSYNGQVVRLTYREAQMVDLLLRRFKQVVHFDVIWSTIWGNNPEASTKLVDVYICKLNKKLRPMGLSIQSSWGIGRALVFHGPHVANVLQTGRKRYKTHEQERAHAV